MAAAGVVAALLAAQYTSGRTLAVGNEERAVAARHAWNLVVLAVFSALFASRIVLLAFNFSALRSHPRWLLAVSMIHHPLVNLAGAGAAVLSILMYSRWQRLGVMLVGDCLSVPTACGLFFEQAGSLLGGSGFGWVTNLPWAVVYTDPIAFQWSGTPLGVPLHPVQAYAAMGYAVTGAICISVMRHSARPGDVFGVFLSGTGVTITASEIFRDWNGRGTLWGGRVDIPQLVGLGLVLTGSAFLVDWRHRTGVGARPLERP